jgi:hypothetical protein
MSMFERRYRGFRIVNFAAILVLFGLMLGVYLAKTQAAADSAAIARTERLIVAEQREIRALQARVAGLETPERIGALSSQFLGMAAAQAKQELKAEALPAFAPKVEPAPPPPTVVAGEAVTPASLPPANAVAMNPPTGAAR